MFVITEFPRIPAIKLTGTPHMVGVVLQRGKL